MFFKGDLKEVGKNKGWCPYYLARYAVSNILKMNKIIQIGLGISFFCALKNKFFSYLKYLSLEKP